MYGKAITYKTTTKCLADNRTAKYEVSVETAENLPPSVRLFKNTGWPCLQTDRDEMSNLHRGHSIDDSYQVSVVAMFVIRSGQNEQSS